ncbi:hypothetical protein [Asticcacaulis sp. AND118]|uniref:hypothetical protein n=1 Tax=Asticcacaulis sp. AND118 TaxID=2840468 RepID=UPI001CFFE248|nr:hypothetical protein [Asticcacaulis sp. AND118]UDF04077.1 hypothetical protein LH365_03280 [Asticcacaulis sp. AND118]
MSYVLSTDDNVRFIKSALRKLFPSVKSAHFSEALATSAGYRTHAAFLADNQRVSTFWPLLINLDADAFRQRLETFGYELPPAVDLLAIIRAPELPDRTHVSFRTKDRYLGDRWYRQCQSRKIPFFYIEQKRKYALIHWDYFSLDPETESYLYDAAGDEIRRSMLATFREIAGRSANDKVTFSGSGYTGTVRNIEPDLAPDLAEAFFAILYRPLYKERPSHIQAA